MKILTIGGATQDVFITYENAETMDLQSKEGKESYLLLKEGSKVEIKDVVYASGGGANNTAFSFKKLGFDVSTVIKIGNDKAGNFIIDLLKKHGINTNHVVVTKQYGTGLSFVIPSLAGDRSILAYRGANAHVTQNNIPLSSFKNYDYIYVSSLSGTSSKLLLPIVKMAKKLNIPVANNPGTSQLVSGANILSKSLPYIDTLILNADESKKLMYSLVQKNKKIKPSTTKKQKSDRNQPNLLGQTIHIEDVQFSLNHFFQETLAMGPKHVVVTNGAEGVYVAIKNKIYFHPGLKVDVVNTLGSGDAFGSSFVGSLAAGKTIEQSIRQGVINAASTVQFMDAKEGLLSMKSLNQKAKKLDTSLLQTFNLT